MTMRIDGSAGRASGLAAISARLGQAGSIDQSAVPMLGDLLTGVEGLTAGGVIEDVPPPPGQSMSPARRFSELQMVRRPLEEARAGAAGVERRALDRCQSVLERYLDMKESALMRAEFHG
jgi:hypothetical protein